MKQRNLYEISAFVDSQFMIGGITEEVLAYSEAQAFSAFVHKYRGRKFWRKEQIHDVAIKLVLTAPVTQMEDYDVERLESDYDQEFDDLGRRIA